MTGAPLPPGAEAIVPVENAKRECGRVEAVDSPRAGEHVRRRGESVRAGAVLVTAGRRLGPMEIALAALAGADPISVRVRPRVTLVATGSELVAVSAKPGPGQLRDSNGPMLAALCLERGVIAGIRGAVADDDTSVRKLFADAGSQEDLLVTSGGVSAGDFDLLPAAAERAGFEILFHGVAMRPGKPVAFARRADTLWLGLPGNPVSSAVCFRLFGAMALDALEGAEPAGPVFVTARLTHPLSLRGRRETFRDARLSVEAGELRAEAVESLGSHDLAAHAGANALLRIPTGAESLPAGAAVACLPLGAAR
jgi:molybdopterin molybdotransferase